MTIVRRWVRFNVVGALGMGVQLATATLLVQRLGVGPVIAMAAAVCAAIVHNFTWHVRWTWRDEMQPGASHLQLFYRFVSANGAVSLAGSMLLMPILLGPVGLSPLKASLATIAGCGLLNFWLANLSLRTSVTEALRTPSPRQPQ